MYSAYLLLTPCTDRGFSGTGKAAYWSPSLHLTGFTLSYSVPACQGCKTFRVKCAHRPAPAAAQIGPAHQQVGAGQTSSRCSCTAPPSACTKAPCSRPAGLPSGPAEASRSSSSGVIGTPRSCKQMPKGDSARSGQRCQSLRYTRAWALRAAGCTAALCAHAVRPATAGRPAETALPPGRAAAGAFYAASCNACAGS